MSLSVCDHQKGKRSFCRFPVQILEMVLPKMDFNVQEFGLLPQPFLLELGVCKTFQKTCLVLTPRLKQALTLELVYWKSPKYSVPTSHFETDRF